MQQRNFFLTLLMAIVMMVFSPQIMRAAVETVTVGERTSSSFYIPYGNYFKNSTTQMLYTADEIGKKGIIQSIALYVSDAYEFKCSELKIYMGETDLTQLSTSNAFNSTGMQLVYSGTDVTIGSASGWETMTLGTPFDYSGEKNLVVVVCRKSSSWTTGLKYGGSDGKSLYRWSDDYSSYADIDDETQYSETGMRAAAQFQIKTSDHVMEHHEAVAPTATTAGNYEYWYCATHCQKYFKDENGEEEYGDNEWLIPAGECPHQLTEHAAVPNTCGDDGNSLYYECSICGKYFSDANGENGIEAGSWVIPADPTMHQYENYDNGFGVCSVCGYVSTSVYQPAEYDEEAQCFKIWNAGQLYWFAYNVNNATDEFKNQYYPYNAEVWENITVNNSVLTDEGELTDNVSNLISWTPIMQYAGTFKGVNGGCISGLYCSKEDSRVGLFAKITASGTVSEVGIKDSYFSGTYNVGGIVGYNEGTIKNSYSLATVNAQSAVGGIGGSNNGNGSIQNCYSQAKVKCGGSTYGSVVGYGSAVNSYYLSDADDYWSHSGVTRVTADQVESGEVAWLLNGSKVDETSVWGYHIDSEYWDYPLPHGFYFVWKGYMCFSNEEIFANHYLHATANHDHVYDNGFCMACEALQTPDSQTIDDVLTFDIANEGNALYVCNYVNQGNTCAARLVASNVKFTKDHCMNLTAGKLTFDLNGDTISAIYSQVINVAGCDLTITDSSEGKKGAVINGGSFAINAASGSLAINAGTFVGGGDGGYAVQTSSSCTSLSISGGKYFVRNGTTSRFYTSGKSALAYGYSYYNARTNEELTDKTNQPIYVSNPSDTVVVKPASVKAVLTKNGVDVNYIDFDSAFSAAQQCTASDNATLKLMKSRIVDSSYGYITFSSGTFTLDLNGDTLQTWHSYGIYVNGANLTITDSSEDKKGAIINQGGDAVNAASGSLIITGGNFKSQGNYALNTSSSCTSLSVSGGTYKTMNTYNCSSIYTLGKSALAEGYSYYNGNTGEELPDYTTRPIYVSAYVDSIVVKPASVKAVLTKNGEDINCYTFEAAFAAAQQCTAEDNATLKLMKNRTIPDGPNAYITLSSGTFTLDLNGDTIRNNNSYTLFVNGANLTITDSSEGQNGALINSYSYAVYIVGGSLTVLGGNFIARNTAPALYVGSPSPTVSLKGGKYMSNNTYGYRVYTYDKSLLAPGYSYYNLSTDEEMNDVTSGYISMSNTADTLIVKPGTVKAVLTRNGEGTNYSDFNAAFTAAQQCTADDNATLKLMKNRTMEENEEYITFSSGTFTLDLNGDTISNCNNQTILVSGANLTITDSSEGQTGMIKNLGAHGVNATSGSLIITGGTFIGSSGFAVQTSSSCTSLAISGGKYYMTSGTSRLYTPGKSALAPGYSYYNLRTGKELEDCINQPIFAEQSTDTVIVKQSSVKAVLTKGDEVTTYRDFNSAFAAAQQCTADDNATLKLMNNRTMPSSEGYITLSSGTFTLDLNGDTISNYNSQTILVSGANLTITDSSEGQNGALINSGSYAVNVTSGSLTVLGGNFIARNRYQALNVGSSSPTVSLKGGKYMSNSTEGYRVYTYDKSLLAPGYSYYNLRTDEELDDITSGYLTMSNTADTLVVKQGPVKAMLTKGDKVTTYKDINAAFAAAQQCTAYDNATLKLLKNVTLPTGNGYITLTDGAFTLDLNGDTLGIMGSWVLKLNGTDLTVTDSSEDKKGALVNTSPIVVYAVSGSLTMESGNLKGKGQYSIYNNEGGMEITLLGGSYNGGIQYHANSTLNLPDVAMFNAEGNEIALKYTEYVNFNCYRTEEPFTVNPYYTVGDVKGKLTKVDNKYFADKLTLVDGMPFNSEYDFTAAEAEYSRTMTTKWGTICLPFDVTVSSVTDKTEEGYQPFDFYYVDNINDDVMTLSKETQKVSAGTGMILRHDGTGGEVSIKETNVEVYAACASNDTDLCGTFTGKTINSGYYIANDKFWNAANLDEGAVVPPYRAYVAGSGWAAAKGISIFDPEEETTGVTTVTADKADADAWYTLDGVKLGAKPNKAGIYIHGGKKVAVK